MEVARFARLPSRTTEEAARAARTAGAGVGFVVDVDLLAHAGAAVIALLDEYGPVLVLAPLAGRSDRVGAAAHRYVRAGAAWVVVDAGSGRDTIAAAVAATAGTGCGIAVATVSAHVDDAGATTAFGTTRGRMVARLARVGAAGGASGAICIPGDIGVVADVAPDLACLAEVRTPGEGVDAVSRGAVALIVPDPGFAL